MANPEHLAKLKEGVEAWNQWRRQNSAIRPDLRRADLQETDLFEANFSRVNLRRTDLNRADLRRADFSEADIRGAILDGANLSGADLREANLHASHLNGAHFNGANLYRANLSAADIGGAELTKANLGEANLNEANLSSAYLDGANLTGADLHGANLSGANLAGANLEWAGLTFADLQGANLSGATLISTNLQHANLTACSVYGISAWNVRLDGAIQSNLVITPQGESPIQVDNLEVAQFIYLLLNNEKIRSVIDTITSKVVLILGSFKDDRKVVLDAIRDELRKRDYLPVLFDFEKPASRDLTETVSTLAHMARFVIADITDAKSIPQELMAIVPNMPSVPVQPLLLASQREYGMFEHFRNYPWVLEEVLYADQQTLLAELSGKVIAPAEAKAKELARK